MATFANVRTCLQEMPSLAFVVKAAIVLALLYAASLALPVLPTFAVGVLWSLLSIVMAIGLAYHAVIGKYHRQFLLKTSGLVSRFINGWAWRLALAFIVSAICVAGLFYEAPKWEVPEWCTVILAVPAYLVVSTLLGKVIDKELEPVFQTSRKVLWSSLIVGGLLCVVYAVICYVQPQPTYATAADAFLAAKQPYAQSPSAIMAEAGKLVALIDGLTAYALSRAGEASYVAYVALRCVLGASAMFGIANLLGVCALGFKEFKQVFLPLEAVKSPERDHPVRKRYIAVCAVLACALTAGFCIADRYVQDAVESGEATRAEQLIREKLDLVVVMIDDKPYRWADVERYLNEAKGKLENLSKDAEAELTPLINAAFDARLANVDAYLDWYYSLPADYERLVSMVTGSAESFAKEQFSEKIESGIDDTQLKERFEQFAGEAAAIKDDLLAKLADCQIADDVPSWLMTVEENADVDLLAKTLEPAEQLLDSNQRFGVSAAAGLAAGFVTKKLLQRIVKKQFFKTIVSKISSMIGSKAIAAGGGGAVGTAIGGPIGTAAGIAVGLGISVGIDYLTLMADEQLNRESYRTEIVEAIEEARADTLALVAR